MSRTTGGTTVFVGTGPFTDAGSISSNGVVTLSKGSFDLNQNIRVKRTINPTTRFVSLIVGGTIGLGLVLVIKTGLRRDFRPGDPTQASDLGKLWISPDFRARM